MLGACLSSQRSEQGRVWGMVIVGACRLGAGGSAQGHVCQTSEASEERFRGGGGGGIWEEVAGILYGIPQYASLLLPQLMFPPPPALS